MHFKKIGAACALAALAATLGAAGAYALDYFEQDVSWYTENADADEFTVAKAGQLQGLSDLVSGFATDSDGAPIEAQSFSGKTVHLGSSITLLGDFGYGFTPIGTEEHPFDGTFDGGGKSIANLRMHVGDAATDSDDALAPAYVGLFGACGQNARICNLTLEDDCSVEVGVADTAQTIRYVGALAGDMRGSVENCTVRAKVSVHWDDGDKGDKRSQDDTVVAAYLGGVAGNCDGNLSHVSFTGNLDVSTAADAYYDKREQKADAIVVRYVGGIAGQAGARASAVKDGSHSGDIDGCTNSASVTVTTTGDGGHDRFGEVVEAKSEYLGGIAGYAAGNVRGCRNGGDVRGTAYVPNGDAKADEDGYNHSAGGATSTGGIVGSLRGATGSSIDPLTVSDCTNTGMVFSLSNVGGIVGQACTWSSITRCANGDAGQVRNDATSALVRGTRWNKPCIGGIAGATGGSVTYCRNHGQVDTYDIGYYVGGIVGSLDSTSDSAGGGGHPLAEIYACYNTGQVECMQSYRRGAIVGGNGGFVHDCCYLFGTAAIYDGQNAAIGRNYGTYTRLSTAYASTQQQGDKAGFLLKSKQAVAALNGAGAASGWGTYYLLSGSANGGYPVLNTESVSDALVDIGSLNPQVRLVENASYTAGNNPEPVVEASVTVDGAQVQLVQNADFFAAADRSALDSRGNVRGASAAGSTPYTCTLTGIGDYRGTAAGCAYGIQRGAFEECTVVVEQRSYTGLAQNDPYVYVVDPAGNVVDAASYTYTINDGADCTNPKTGGYPVVCTARSSSNYYGAAKGTYVIDQIDLARACDTTGVVYGNRVWYYDEERYQLYEVKPVLDEDGELTYHADTGFPVVEGEGSYVSEDGVTFSYAEPKLRDADGRTVFGMSVPYTGAEINPKPIGVVWQGKVLAQYPYDTAGLSEGWADKSWLKYWWGVEYGGGAGGFNDASADGSAPLPNIESSTTGAITVHRWGVFTRNYVVMNFDIEPVQASKNEFQVERNFGYYKYNDGKPPVTALNRATQQPVNLLYRGNKVSTLNYELVPSYSVDNVTGARHEGEDITFNAGDTVYYDVHFKDGGSIVCDDIEDAVYFTIIDKQTPFNTDTVSVEVDDSKCAYSTAGTSNLAVTVTDRTTGEKLVQDLDYEWDLLIPRPGSSNKLNVQGLGRYAGVFSIPVNVRRGEIDAGVFSPGSASYDPNIRVVNCNTSGTSYLERLGMCFPWRAGGYTASDLESVISVAWKTQSGYGLNARDSMVIVMESGKLFAVSDLRDANGNSVDAISEPGNYTVHLAHRENADANHNGNQYFDTSEDFSMDVGLKIAPVNLDEPDRYTNPETGAVTLGHQFATWSMRLSYERSFWTGSWPPDKDPYKFDASELPYTGKPQVPRLEVLDSSQTNQWIFSDSYDASAVSIPLSDIDVHVTGYGTQGPTEVSSIVTNPYVVSAISAKQGSAHVSGTYTAPDNTYSDRIFAIVAADLSEFKQADAHASAEQLASGKWIVVDDAAYTGSAVEPDVRFYIDGVECAYVRGQDYELEYADNVSAGLVGDEGAPSVTVRILDRKHLTAHDASGARTDSVTLPFNIRYTAVDVADVSWELGASVALVEGADGSASDRLAAPALFGSYDSPDASAQRLEVPQGACKILSGTYAGGSKDGAGRSTGGTFTPRESGWAAGEQAYFQISADPANPAFTGSVVVGPVSVAAPNSANSFTFANTDGAGLSVQLDDAFAYTGEQLKPEPRVALADGGALVRGRDYTLEYGSNVNVAAADGPDAPSVTVRGMGAYTGTYTRTFAIEAARLESCTVEVAPQVYTGSQIAPKAEAVTVRLGGVELAAGDWAIDANGYGANVDAGGGTLRVVSGASGNVASGSIEATFEIRPLALSKERFVVSCAAKPYTGNPWELAAGDISVTDTAHGAGGDALVFGRDFTVNYTDGHTNAGSAGILVTGKGNYTGSLSASFAITPRDISSAKLRFTGTAAGASAAGVLSAIGPDGLGDSAAFAYSATDIRPHIAVTLDGVTLSERYTATTGEEHGDYTLSYANNTDAATGAGENAPRVTVSGAGNYTGRVSATFQIEPAVMDADNAAIELDASSFVYRGASVEPAVTVRFNGRALDAADYELSFANNTAVASADGENPPTVVATARGGNLTGSVSATFSIIEATLSGAKIAPIPDQLYAFGKAVEPQLTVTGPSGEILEAKRDYTATWHDNMQLGSASVTLEGAGAYHGSVSASFEIVKVPISVDDISLSPSAFLYDGLDHEPQVSVTVGGRALEQGSDYTVEHLLDTRSTKGAHPLEISCPASSFYTAGGGAGIVVVYRIDEPRDFSSIVAIGAIGEQVLSGGAVEPHPVVELVETNAFGASQRTPLSEGVDYTLSWSGNEQPGWGTVTVSGTGWYTGSASARFAIRAAQPKVGQTAGVKLAGGAVVSVRVGVGGTATLTGASGLRQASTLSIPETVSVGAAKLKVTAIAAHAFSGSALKAAVVPSSVKSIGAGAFSGCTKLKTVTVKGKLFTKKKVKGCFKGLKKLTVKVSVGAKKENKKFVKKYKKVFTKGNCGVKKKLAVK